MIAEQIESSPEQHRETFLLNHSKVRRLAQEKGKRVSPEFIAQLEGFLRRKIEAACGVHNGGRKTLDASIAGFVGIK